ncbi:DMT family transporter [Epibacterium ulvae]|uniref:DMT family transporter n=1 Tax=Epibacterium ulvae TaxID=1156985 RepID=UPI001BFCAAE1|nr:DMT family transporter [Epibacterium ulvae]MBT8155565.1 DMT family transporter [Epibacterium ulvae]
MTDAAAMPPDTSPLRGVFWMFVTGVNFVAVTVVIKIMDGRLPPYETAFLRYVLGLVFLLPVARSLLSAHWTRRAHMILGARGLLHGVGVGGWFYAMAHIPLAEVTAIGYLSPIFITVGAVLVLGERMAFRRMAAIGVAFIGALIILRPGVREISFGHLAMLATALTFGVSHLMAKLAMRDATPTMVVAMLSLWVPIALAPFALADWVPPSTADLGLLFLVACFATTGHYTMMLAFQAAPVTTTQPVTFLQLVWATLIGTVFFGEALDIWVVVGGLLILTCITYISWREAVLKRRSVTPPAVAAKLP